MRSDQQIFILHHDSYALFLLDRAFYHDGVTNPVRICRHRNEARCFLAGEGAYADRKAHPLPDLLLIEIELPNEETLSLLKWIRSTLSLKHIPIVGLASRARTPQIQEAFDHGIKARYSLPDQSDQLALFVKNLDV